MPLGSASWAVLLCSCCWWTAASDIEASREECLRLPSVGEQASSDDDQALIQRPQHALFQLGSERVKAAVIQGVESDAQARMLRLHDTLVVETWARQGPDADPPAQGSLFGRSVQNMLVMDHNVSRECSKMYGESMLEQMRGTTHAVCGSSAGGEASGQGLAKKPSSVVCHERVPFDIPRYTCEMKDVKVTERGVSAQGCAATDWLPSAKLGVTESEVFGASPKIELAESLECDASCSVDHKALIQKPWDSHNLYEWYGDWVTLYETLAMLEWDPDDVQIFLIGDLPAKQPFPAPFDESWSLAFRRRGVRGGSFKELFGKTGCCFSHVATVPHGGLSTTTFQGGRGGIISCASPTLMASAKYLSSLYLQQAQQSDTPEKKRVILMLRSGSRAFVNDKQAEQAVSKVLPEGWELVTFRPEQMPDFADQIKFVSTAAVLVGVHGAGMTHTLFLPRHAHLVEFFCGDRNPSNHHYRNLEAMTEGHYHPSDMEGSCEVDSNLVAKALQASDAGK